MTESISIGIIGAGNIARQHIQHIANGAVPRCRVSAICSRSDNGLAAEADATHYSDYRALIDSGSCDAVLIATPTRLHYEMGSYALSQGLHVLMEKPIGLSLAEGQQLLQQASQRQVFALMLNQRTDPVFRHMKQLLDDQQLGRIQRCHWTMTHWFRPEVYYQVSDWRATWRGEGGGLLVNQCIHNLDILHWLCGMPVRLQGFCGFGKYHDIEVEDEVTAYFEYANGATGVFIGSTGEAPGVNRFDIVGDRGTLSYDGNRLQLATNEPDSSSFSSNTRDMFGMPACSYSDITPDTGVNQHALVISNFVDAIVDGSPLIAAAEEGLASLALANAILLSSWTGQAVELPLDASAYQLQLDQRIAGSQLRQAADIEAIVDMDKSYR